MKVIADLQAHYLKQWLATSADKLDQLQAIKMRQDGLTAFLNDLGSLSKGGEIANFNSRTRLRNENTK